MKRERREGGTDVLFVLSSADRRGAETEGRNVAKALREQGGTADAVALSPARFGAGLDVDVIGTKPISAATLRELRRRARGCGTVIAFGSTSLPACAIATAGLKTRLIYRSIGNPSDWVRGRLHRMRTGLLFRRVDHVAALWDDAAQSFGDLYSVPVDQTSVIPNFRSPDIFSPTSIEGRRAARAKYGLDDSELVVAYVGALSKEKRPDLAVAAMEHLPKATLLLAGDGPLRPAVETQVAATAPGRVQLLGSLADVTSIYRAADVLLLTSDTEGMPGVLLEAALSGVPAASSEVGAVSALVRSGCCIEIFPPGSPAVEVASAVIRASTRRGDAAEAVGRVSGQYSTTTVVECWAGLLSVAET